jgi:hypothetical protein
MTEKVMSMTRVLEDSIVKQNGTCLLHERKQMVDWIENWQT